MSLGMSDVRYFMGLLVVMFLPPGIGWWYLVHPFVGFWRRVGVVGTMTSVTVFTVGGAGLLYLARDVLMGVDLGTHRGMVTLAALAMAPAMWIALRRRRHLTFRILAGVPELDPSGRGGELLTEGPYAVVRHPRYVEVALGTLAYAFLANWSGPYVVTALALPALHGIVLLEERELRARFAEAYEEYAARVPRYLPPLRRSP